MLLFPSRAALPSLLASRGFLAAALNAALMLLYVWADYGRGFLASDVGVLDALYIFGAFSYVGAQALYLSLLSGAQPWPSGWSVLAEWASIVAQSLYAATSIMYLDKSGALAVPVLVIECVGALLNAAAATCAFTGWWLERPLAPPRAPGAPPRAPLAARLARDGYAWAHATNFVPAIIYIASSLTAMNLAFFRVRAAPGDAEVADADQFSALLRSLARIYWYGDVGWAVNAFVWLGLCVHEAAVAEAEEAEEEAGAGGGGGGDAASTPASGDGGLKLRLLDGADADGAGGLVPLPHALERPSPAHRRARRRWAIKETTPYRLFGPCERSLAVLRGEDPFAAGDGEVDSPLRARPPPLTPPPHTPPPRAPPPPPPPADAAAVVGRMSSGRVLRFAAGVAAVGSVQAVKPLQLPAEIEMRTVVRGEAVG